jgi:hypothetical protein
MATREHLNDTLSRADEVLRRKIEREEAELKRADAEREIEAIERNRRYAEKKRQTQQSYADAFASFGTEVPRPEDDELPSRYRKRLFDRLVRRLPPDHDLAAIRADDISSQQIVFDNFEAMLLTAAQKEGLSPSPVNLPPDGSLISRQRVDAETGGKQTHFYGRQSFIKGLGSPGRIVERIFNPKTGMVLMGPAFPRADY